MQQQDNVASLKLAVQVFRNREHEPGTRGQKLTKKLKVGGISAGKIKMSFKIAGQVILI